MDHVYILWTSDEWNSWDSARIYAVCADQLSFKLDVLHEFRLLSK